MGIIAKVKYTCDCGGEVVERVKYLEYKDGATLSDVVSDVNQVIDGLHVRKSYPVERPRVISVNIFETEKRKFTNDKSEGRIKPNLTVPYTPRDKGQTKLKEAC